jgi:hypothetical protein
MTSQLLITNQTNVLTTWFLNLHLDKYIDNTKAQSWNFDSKAHEAQLDEQKPKKSSRRSSRRRKKSQNQQMRRKATNQGKSKEKLQLKTPPKTYTSLTISLHALPLR